MWGVLLFIKFGWCVGRAGLLASIGAVMIAGLCQLLSASSLSAVATNGIVTRSGGECFLRVRADRKRLIVSLMMRMMMKVTGVRERCVM